VLAAVYLFTKIGITINMTYTNKDKPQAILTDENKDSVQNAAIDKVIAEIYDAFDINVDSGEADE
jgi:hypothetical protein